MEKTRRRFTLAALASGALAPLVSIAQQRQAVRRVGVISTRTHDAPISRVLREELLKLGYEEGKNVAVVWRFSEGKNERLPAFAQELARLDLEVIVAHTNESVAAVRQVIRTVPIVMCSATLPVENGFVDSLARPGGNVTGTTWSGPEQAGKVLQTLKEAAPGAMSVAALWNRAYPGAESWIAEAERAAKQLGVVLQSFYVTGLNDVEPVLKRIAAARPDALFVSGGQVFNAKAREIAAFATERRLVSIAIWPAYTDNGGLLYTGPELQAIFARTASYVDRILRGAKPADLPVELPTKYELVINAKTARAIGYKIPPSLLARADRVIE